MPREKLTEEAKAERREEKKKKQEIERIASSLKRDLQYLREDYINEPTYFFKIGDRVRHGALIWSKVSEVIDNGKIYKLRELCKGNRREPDYERDSYVAWTDLRPYKVRNEDRSKAFSYEADKFRQIHYMQQSIDSLLSRNYGHYAGIDTEPDYQRDLVWELKDKEALIDSIFQKIDIGKFTFIKRPYKKNQKGCEVLDGKQRLNTIVEFYEDRFTYKGKTFTELHWFDQHTFTNCPISIGETDPMTDKEKYEYFLRLNTGGKPQDQKHIEHVRKLLNG